MSEEISDVTRRILRAHFDVNAFDANWMQSLKRTLNNAPDRDRAAIFRNDLARAIRHGALSLAQYEQLTGEAFDTPDELEDWLREVWQRLYGDAPIEVD